MACGRIAAPSVVGCEGGEEVSEWDMLLVRKHYIKSSVLFKDTENEDSNRQGYIYTTINLLSVDALERKRLGNTHTPTGMVCFSLQDTQ